MPTNGDRFSSQGASESRQAMEERASTASSMSAAGADNVESAKKAATKV